MAHVIEYENGVPRPRPFFRRPALIGVIISYHPEDSHDIRHGSDSEVVSGTDPH